MGCEGLNLALFKLLEFQQLLVQQIEMDSLVMVVTDAQGAIELIEFIMRHLSDQFLSLVTLKLDPGRNSQTHVRSTSWLT